MAPSFGFSDCHNVLFFLYILIEFVTYCMALCFIDANVAVPTISIKPLANRVKSGIFGQTAKFGQPPRLFHSSIIGIKNRLTKQRVKILMRRLRSRLIWISTVCKCVSEFT